MNEKIPLPIRRTDDANDLPLPRYQSEWASGLDLPAFIEEAVTLSPNEKKLIPTGFAIGLPLGYEAQVRPRSGLAAKHGVTVLNAPGTIDADYRGEIKVLLINLGEESFTIHRGDRIAQLIIAPVVQAALELKNDLNETARGAGGFGHTGQ